MRRLAAFLWLLLLPAPLSAQAPGPAPAGTAPGTAASPPPAPPTGKGKGRGGDKGGDKDAQPAETEPGEILIRADRQGGEKGHYEFRGFVDLQAGDSRIQADSLDYYEEEKPEGGTRRRIHAEGNVVFMRDEEHLAGDKLDMNLDDNTGTFQDAVGYVQPGVFVEAKSIDRLAANTYKIHGGRFTSCAQPNPRWSFGSTAATLHVNERVTGHNVVFRVKGVPAFYLPYFIYPIEKDQRSTGFLFPHVGYSNLRGYDIREGFFWAMGRSVDQTFYVDHYSRYGWGFGHELRYMRDSPSRGSFRTYLFRVAGKSENDYDLNWNALQMLPGQGRMTLQVRQYSNLEFQQNIQENLDYISGRTRRSIFTVDKRFGNDAVQLLADSTETFFGSNYRINRHLPSLKVSRTPKKSKGTGVVFSYEARAEELGLGVGTDLTTRSDYYSRFDLLPRVSRPVSWSFLQLNPQVQLRYTRYGERLQGVTLGGDPVSRRYAEASLEWLGPNFSRVFNTPGNFYSEKYKHVVGPEATWRYRTAIDNFNEIPRFDGNDYVLGTNQVDYALVNHLFAKRPNRFGRVEPWEFLNWRIGQTYYVQISNKQNEFDPNYSSAYFGPGGVPAHYSPLQSRLRIRPTPTITTTWDYEYDTNFHQMRTLGLAGSVNVKRFSLTGAWSRAKNVAKREENRFVTRDTLRGDTRLVLLPDHLTLEGAVDYDLLNQELLQVIGRGRYSVQCCGISMEVIKSLYNARQETQFRFSIDLANIGSIGSFMGQDQNRGTGSFY